MGSWIDKSSNEEEWIMDQMNTLEKIIKFHIKMTQITDIDKGNS